MSIPTPVPNLVANANLYFFVTDFTSVKKVKSITILHFCHLISLVPKIKHRNEAIVSCRPIFFQHLYPKSQIDVYVTILEDDGCTLAAALTVSGLALADAAIQMFDNLVGASVVRISIIQYRR